MAAWFQNFDLGRAGFVIVALFVFTWLAALAIWHFGHIEERWTRALERGAAAAEERA